MLGRGCLLSLGQIGPQDGNNITSVTGGAATLNAAIGQQSPLIILQILLLGVLLWLPNLQIKQLGQLIIRSNQLVYQSQE